ncbi:antibiotic biosynthesis monooxygenase [Paenibacillus spiritus]|uniref:Antibiotic biosynthesis monooxygenase n=1 Tax=Paenibacillus spiritus TaxID=2496557 RepID=A0A5J5G9A6_9BACL|nr:MULTISPECIES: antibiotic biosynthesis monooxygenase [Paenibacillus]KAA9004114.1 antibiotic biosynthesis monooxygenase [Paenibacillus spiritus]
MFIVMRTTIVDAGFSDRIVERFQAPGPLQERDGLLDISVMVNRKAKETEEVVTMIRWESEEAWKNWEKSEEHIQGHRNSRGQQPLEFIRSVAVQMYNVRMVKEGKAFGSGSARQAAE